MADLNKISSSKYDIYSKLLDILSTNEYITNQSEFANTDFVKTGVLGYATEALAMIMRDSSFHKTMIYRENFLNTAIMPRSIYNWAKTFKVDIIDARPSMRYATIMIETQVIDNTIANSKNSYAQYKDKYGIAEAGSFMVIDKTNPIVAGEYYFSLEHSIEIYKNNIGRYIVKYCMNEKDKSTNFGNYSTNGLINTEYYTNRETDTKYLVFKVLVAQYKTVEYSKIISGSSYIDTKIHQFIFDGQLCGMSAKYIKGNTEENIELKFSNIELESDKNAQNKIAYYSVVDENTLELNFISNNISGMPQTGGVINLKTYITEGFSGNISYNGEAVMILKQDDVKSIPIIVELSSDIESSGMDNTSLGSLKDVIVDKLSTRDTIITENDLNSWFATQSSLLENISNSNMTFRKEKDNILKRLFSVYLLLRDGTSMDTYLESNDDTRDTSVINSSYISNLVPTNTIDVALDVKADDTEYAKHVYPNQPIYYHPSTNNYILDSSSNSDYKYNSPFYIDIDTKYNTVSYYYMETSDSSELEFTNVQQMEGLSIIPTQVKVEHSNVIDSSSDDTYVITFNVSSDADLSQKTINSANIIFDNDIYTIDAGDIDKLKFIEVGNKTDGSALNDYIIRINCKNNGITSDKLLSRLSLSVGNGNNLITANVLSEMKIGLSFSFTDKSFEGTMSSIDKLAFFMELDDVISSDLVYQYDVNSNISRIIIKNVPVVANYWFTYRENKAWFIKQLLIFINMLKQNIDKLETTTFFGIKFMNTYGPSYQYNSLSTQLRLGLRIYMDTDKARNTANLMSFQTDESWQESIKNEIRDYIRVAVDKANDDNELVISKIIMQTQAAYNNFIKHIDFTGLNGTFTQYIKRNESDDLSKPLEYFSLDQTIELDGVKKNRLNDDIQFIFE